MKRMVWNANETGMGEGDWRDCVCDGTRRTLIIFDAAGGALPKKQPKTLGCGKIV